MPRIRATSCTCGTDASASASWPSSRAGASRSWPKADRVSYVRDLSVVEPLRGGAVLATGIVGSLPEVVPPISLLPNDELLLVRADAPGSGHRARRVGRGGRAWPSAIARSMRPSRPSGRAQSRRLDDGKIGGIVTAKRTARRSGSRSPRPGRTAAGCARGRESTFPTRTFAMSALTAKDLADLGAGGRLRRHGRAAPSCAAPTASCCSRIIFTASVPGTWVSC